MHISITVSFSDPNVSDSRMGAAFMKAAEIVARDLELKGKPSTDEIRELDDEMAVAGFSDMGCDYFRPE